MVLMIMLKDKDDIARYSGRLDGAEAIQGEDQNAAHDVIARETAL